MKKLVAMLLLLVMLSTLLVACGPEEKEPDNTENPTPQNAVKFEDIDLSSVVNFDLVTLSEAPTDYVLLDVAGYGKILIRLYPDVAPETVANFKALVASGFYDGLIFHRVIKDFMIQGGDPRGDGTGGSSTNIKGEFEDNGFENNLKHLRGVVSMARSDDPDSASSQFFICQGPEQKISHLDGKYAAFGYVVYGMNVVDAIAGVNTNANDKPTTNIVITSAKFATVPAEAMLDPLDLLTVSTEATDYVLLDIENYGKILIHLYADEAPETVANFKALVASGFYDGLTFHRVIKNFIIQGGDPRGDGTGGSGTTIPGEFASNGTQNRISHLRGVVSMARDDDPNSASSQFFICHKDAPDFDGDRAAFGYVLAGMETVDAITNVSVNISNKPKTTVRITSAKFVVVEEGAYDVPSVEDLSKNETPAS